MGLQLGAQVGLNDGSAVGVILGSSVTGFGDGRCVGLGVTGDKLGD